MFSIEQSGRDWVVVQDGVTMSVHPRREEAERAVEWLRVHSVSAPEQALLFGDLTPRELVVLQSLSRRGSYAEIARELFVSTNTIKTHVRNIYAKFGVTDRAAALAAAKVLGLLDNPLEVRAHDDAGDIPDPRMAAVARAARKYLSALLFGLRTNDWTAYARLHRRDARQISPVMTCNGIDAIIDANRRILEAIPDIGIDATHVTIDPYAHRAIFDCLCHGTLAGALLTPHGVIPATGQHFQFQAMYVVTFDDSDLVSETRRYWDLYEVLRNQGLAKL